MSSSQPPPPVQPATIPPPHSGPPGRPLPPQSGVHAVTQQVGKMSLQQQQQQQQYKVRCVILKCCEPSTISVLCMQQHVFGDRVEHPIT